jgi:HAD superfamily hydrolase (TIGR01549 family)
MRSKYETLLFDFGGTLDADGIAWKERMHAHYGAEGLAMTAEAFAPAFFAADDPLVGGLPVEADLSATVASLARNLEAELARRDQTAAGERGERIARRFLGEAEAAFARNRPLLQELAGRYRLGVVSNFYGNLEAVCRGAGLAPCFAVMIDSQRVGAEKPDPAIFKAALEPLGARPETTLFIGDSLKRDREGARRMGMDFLWIAPPDVAAAERTASGGALPHPVLARLGELEDMLA